METITLHTLFDMGLYPGKAPVLLIPYVLQFTLQLASLPATAVL